MRSPSSTLYETLISYLDCWLGWVKNGTRRHVGGTPATPAKLATANLPHDRRDNLSQRLPRSASDSQRPAAVRPGRRGRAESSGAGQVAGPGRAAQYRRPRARPRCRPRQAVAREGRGQGGQWRGPGALGQGGQWPGPGALG
jgi:hypothetical protein